MAGLAGIGDLDGLSDGGFCVGVLPVLGSPAGVVCSARAASRAS